MCDSRQPTEGADSSRLPSYPAEPSWQPRPFRVRLKDEGPAFWLTVNAIGPNDAKNLAREKAYAQGVTGDVGVIAVEEVVAEVGV